MSFSAEWLALREPVDHASRNAAVADAVRAHFSERTIVHVIDLGCGTGSNLRASVPLLGPRQEWLLVDHDADLLVAARARLIDWADRSRAEDGMVRMVKDGRDITARFLKADLTRDIGTIVAARADLVTASALFDLVSAGWIGQFAQDVAAAGSAFYTVLTYDGRDAFAPAHPLDGAVIAAFAAHQKGDKGFGPAVGPDGASTLASAFRAAAYRVAEGDSPWRIGPAEAALAGELLTGIAAAVGETGAVPADALSAWLAFRRSGLSQAGALLLTGHQDTFAVPE
jgi:SAM-dependent methyltransferase